MKPNNTCPTIAWNEFINVTVALTMKDVDSLRGILQRLKIPYVVNERWEGSKEMQQIVFKAITISELAILSNIINSFPHSERVRPNS